MSDPDLSTTLRRAIELAGDRWRAQPSILRRGLNELLGADATRLRAQVHLLVVAADEKVPTRLAVAGGDPARLGEIAQDLAATRGWTDEAASWAVTTWAAAMGPATSTSVPLTSVPPVSVPPVAVVDEMTALPDDPEPVAVSTPPVIASAPPVTSALPSAPPPDVGSMTKNRRSQVARRSVERFLGEPVDAVFVGYTGLGPTVHLVLFGFLVVAGIAAMGSIVGAAAPPLPRELLLTEACVAIVTGLVRRLSPMRWVALQGVRVRSIVVQQPWFLGRMTPERIAFDGPLGSGERVEGSARSVMLGDERVYFIPPFTKAAALLASRSGDVSAR